MMSAIVTAVTAGLETAFNRYLRLDPDILPQLAVLDGAIIAVDLAGLGASLYLLPGVAGVRVSDRYDGEPTVQIRGTPVALARYWRSARAPGDEIAVEGDTAVAREFQAILARMDIDWEEQLSNVIGDVAARQVGNLWRGIRGWGQRVGDILSRDGAEYLQHELRAVPPRHAVEQFLNAVDALREDADRLTARVQRLRRRATTGDSA